MAASSKSKTFSSGDTIASADVNTNFDELHTFLNDEVIHKDGSKAMTGELALSGVPTSALSATTKAYVDGAITSQAVTSLSEAEDAAETSTTILKSAVIHKLGATSFQQMLLYGDSAISWSGATYEDYTVTFGDTFTLPPTVTIGVHVDASAGYYTFNHTVHNITTTGCTVRLWCQDVADVNDNTAVLSRALSGVDVHVNWMAAGTAA